MKIIVAGGRDFNNYNLLKHYLNKIINKENDIIICGDAQGADMLGAQWAVYNNVPIHHFPAYWNTYGKSAGFIRNAEMGEFADAAILFWDGKSKGTAHMIKTMKLKKKPYIIFNYKGNRVDDKGMEVEKDADYNLAVPW